MDEDTIEDEMLEVEIGYKEEDVYSDEGRADLVEDDEITPEEEGFMEGAEYDGQQAKCANCGKMLGKENTVEKQIEGEVKWFCSEHCVEKFEEKQEE